MKLRKAARVIILGILHILILLPKVLCSGVFELKLANFTNERGLDSNGNCCNGVLDSTNSGLGPTCTDPCHTFFTICLTNYMVDIPHDLKRDKCVFGYVETKVLGSNSFNFDSVEGFINPISFHFNFSWPGTFSIIIQSWHDVTLTNPVTGSVRKQILYMGAQRHLQVGREWSNYRYIYRQTATTPQDTLEYRYRVYCDTNYYGADCSISCRPRDDHFGHYTCSEEGQKVCMDGWNGSYCDQAICLEGCNGYCDRPNECKCRSGWEGPMCNQCTVYPGCAHGYCNKTWECICHEGWGGLFCTLDLNYCTNHFPCLNDGVCQNSGSGSYTCICPEGYSGTTCERENDDCKTQPCENGGTCKDIGTDFLCQCPIGFTGKICDEVAESCEKNPCKNGATCIEGLGSYSCQCKTGFTGKNCDAPIYECDNNPCENNGRCIDDDHGYTCACDTGFSGNNCEENDNDCINTPCKHGATCIDLVNDFECRCVPGFVGNLCEINVDDCVTRPCGNGGICKDLVNDFECTCRPGFTGKFCIIDVDECLSAPCRNGANCTDSVDDYHCACVGGFTGKNCQYLPGQETTEPTVTTSKPDSNVDNGNNATVKEHLTNVEDEVDLTMSQLLLIVCLGVGIPLLLIIIAVTVLLCRKRRSSRDTSKEEEENVQNSINNKLRESQIFTTIPSSSSTISNLTSKISNEDSSDFNTLKSYRHSRPVSQIYTGEKPINNKQNISYNKDIQIHSKHRDYEKTTKKLEKEPVQIDPSNLDVREYCSSHDIHFIDKHINRDTFNRNSLLILEPQIHQEPHRHSSYYGDDVLATEV